MNVLIRAILLSLLLAGTARAEDGYDLWLRYRPVEHAWLKRYLPVATEIVAEERSPSILAARGELERGLSGMLWHAVPVRREISEDGAVVIGTPAKSRLIAALHLPLSRAGNEGFLLRSTVLKGRNVTIITGNTDVGVLYGAFAFLRLIQTRQPIEHLNIVSAPKIELRILDHWDNLDGSVDRGYAGRSIWHWSDLPEKLDPRTIDYARANASIGINGAVLNNVNADPAILTGPYLEKVAALADLFRPYGIRVYLSARFSAPIDIGGLKTADPLDPQVIAWWKAKADEIYRLIPDFGGFLVKANSEGQPGPQDYHRTHADGANMLADVLKPHGGIVMWRAFVYSSAVPEDRAKQAYDEFKPLDGKFRDNVLLQVKNGPIDFQPREPFHPLFGAMPHTNTMIEFQITKEYLGQATHLVDLGALYEEVLKSDTFVQGRGSTVAKVIDGSVFHTPHSGMAGVANIGDERNWCGSIFNQANWYAFGRLAWNPEMSSRWIAEEWARQTFTDDHAFVAPVVNMMMASREAVVDYMTPLGLAHQMATGHHYGPGPWIEDAGRADWNPVYYNRADANGIGFDRTKTGSNAVAQYAPPLARKFSDVARTPEEYLLWFHHLPWTYRMKSGVTLWQALVEHYTRGVEEAAALRQQWAALKPYVDAERFAAVAADLDTQVAEAKWWRDTSIAYFQSVSKLPLPRDVPPPPHDLDFYKSITLPPSATVLKIPDAELH
jgi:alpha-glucuronidase